MAIPVFAIKIFFLRLGTEIEFELCNHFISEDTFADKLASPIFSGQVFADTLASAVLLRRSVLSLHIFKVSTIVSYEGSSVFSGWSWFNFKKVRL